MHRIRILFKSNLILKNFRFYMLFLFLSKISTQRSYNIRIWYCHIILFEQKRVFYQKIQVWIFDLCFALSGSESELFCYGYGWLKCLWIRIRNTTFFYDLFFKCHMILLCSDLSVLYSYIQCWKDLVVILIYLSTDLITWIWF